MANDALRSGDSLRVRRVAVSALEAASASVESGAQAAATASARRRKASGSGAAAALPETPAGMPRRKARLQQTPTVRSVRKASASAAAAAAARTAAEIEASFDQLVRNTTVRAKTQARRANSDTDTNGVTMRRMRGNSASSSPSTPVIARESSATSVQRRHLTRSATKASQQQHHVSSPASSVETEVLESIDEDEDESEANVQQTPSVTRKRQGKRAVEDPATSVVRSSKRLRAQRGIPSSLPPARAPLAPFGNTEEDEELLQIQKRLVFGGKSRKPKAAKRETSRSRSTSENDSTAEEDDADDGDDAAPVQRAKATATTVTRLPRSSPRKRSDQKQRLSASFSILEDVEALPKSSKHQKSARKPGSAGKAASSSASKSRSSAELVLCGWAPQWPPAYARAGGDGSSQKQQLQLVLEGQVLGRDASFQVARRVSESQFVSASAAGDHVKLNGCIDVERACARGVPVAVMELLVDGLPTHWRRKLEALLPSKKPSKRKARAKTHGDDSASEPEAESESDAPKSTKHSRSGRVIAPVMDWWRGERLTTDVNGVTIVDHGSPAFISSPPKKKNVGAASSTKPPRTPNAALKTPLKAKTPRAKTPVAKASAVKAKQAIKDLKARGDKKQVPDASEWTEEQLQALAAAKMQIPTTASNFWAEVATFVSGKTANECRTKSFEEFTSPTSRAAAQKKKQSEAAAAAVAPASTTKIPAKIHRAGSNLFKKQVRQFVQQYEKKHVDDLFLNTTPSKSELEGTTGLDDIKSPSAPLDNSANLSDNDDDDFVGGGRELLEEISSNKRDEVDSYVLSLKRGRVLGEPAAKSSSASARMSFLTPSTLKKKTKSMKRAVHMYEAVGSHRMEGVVSPGGTTRVRINKDSDATSDDEDERDSEDEHSDDDDVF